MAGLTLAKAEAKLAEWLAIDSDLSLGQTVRFGERLLTRADAAEVRENIKHWDSMCKSLEATETGQGRSRTVTPSW